MLEVGTDAVNLPLTLDDSEGMDHTYKTSQTPGQMVDFGIGIREFADKYGFTYAEVFNAQRKANNAALGENKPLIGQSVLDEVKDPNIQRLIFNGYNNKTRSLRGASMHDRTSIFPGNIRKNMIGPTGALTYESNKQAYLNVGNALVKGGFKVSEQSAFDEVDPVHAGNSYHNYDEAFDVTHQTGDYNTSIEKTRKLKEVIRSMNLFKEVIGPGDGDPNHETHLHLGGLMRPITQEELDLINSIN